MSETRQGGAHAPEANGGRRGELGIEDLTGTYGFADVLVIGDLKLFQRTFEIQPIEGSYVLKINGVLWGRLIDHPKGAGPWLFRAEIDRFISVGRCALPQPSAKKHITITFLQYDDLRSDPTTTGIWLGTSSSGGPVDPPPGA